MQGTGLAVCLSLGDTKSDLTRANCWTWVRFESRQAETSKYLITIYLLWPTMAPPAQEGAPLLCRKVKGVGLIQPPRRRGAQRERSSVESHHFKSLRNNFYETLNQQRTCKWMKRSCFHVISSSLWSCKVRLERWTITCSVSHHYWNSNGARDINQGDLYHPKLLFRKPLQGTTAGMCSCFVCWVILNNNFETGWNQLHSQTSGLSPFVQRSSRNSCGQQPNICASSCGVPSTVLPCESREVYLDTEFQQLPVSRQAHLSCCSLGRESAQALVCIYIPIHMHWVLHTLTSWQALCFIIWACFVDADNLKNNRDMTTVGPVS